MANSPTSALQQSGALRITRSLGQAINLLKFSNRELAAFLAFQEAVNPHLSLQADRNPPARASARGCAPTGSAAEAFPVDQIAGPPASIHEHAKREIGLVLRSEHERAIGDQFVAALEPTGWLGRSVEDIARDAGCDRTEAETVLAKIQRIDPPGLFARSLAECLRLQAEDAGVLSDQLSCLLDNLPMLARGEFDALAKLCGCGRGEISDHFATIRGFNPKPGLALGVETPRSAPPDLVVSVGEDGLDVELNRSTLPTLTVRDVKGLDGSNLGMLDAAKAVARAVERRNISTLQIAAEIIRRQSDFLRDGPAALRPLALRDVADVVGMHESTVSRVTAGLRIDTPRGPMGLRDLFSGALSTEGGPVSTVAVRARIGDMIEAEDPARPLTDRDIAARLSEAGIRIARRTVAKYRDELRIAGAAKRGRANHPRRG
ncbi:RNA polymerase factor sigma-54 [Defluviimonas sp. SAOS-178_SWC]|uniref:RNA polymerase factor sigma-54 n=1 Tax=Defluviimonas sp. SAOS-178_SWC TaxID=3121287 RepID=UPI003221C0ED